MYVFAQGSIKFPIPPSLGGGGKGNITWNNGKQEEIFSSYPLLVRKSSEKGAFGQENQDLKNVSWEEYQVEKNYLHPCICMM